MGKAKAPGRIPIDELQRQVRLLVSWQEQANRLQASAAQNGAEPPFDKVRFQSFDEYCAANVHEAAARLSRLREEQHPQLNALATDLRAALKTQTQILDQVGAGSLSAGKANRLNRVLAKRVRTLRSEIAARNRLFSAKKSADLGAFVHLPLEKYADKLEHPPGSLSASLSAWDRGAILVAGLLVVLVVAAGLYYTFGRGQVRFTAHLGPQRDRVFVTCTNNTRDTILLCLPWPLDPVPDSLRKAYGIEVQVRMPGNDAYRRLSSDRSLWAHQGRPTIPDDPLRIRPRLSDEIVLDLSPVGSVEKVLLICSQGDGAELARFVLDVARGV